MRSIIQFFRRLFGTHQNATKEIKKGAKLSEIPWSNLFIGLPVLSRKGTPGKITELLDDTQDRSPSIWIDWETGKKSWVFHHQADLVTCL